MPGMPTMEQRSVRVVRTREIHGLQGSPVIAESAKTADKAETDGEE